MRITRAALAAGSPSAAGTVTAVPAAADGPVTPVDEMSDDDLRASILRILADEDSGRRIIPEAGEALDSGSAEVMRQWLETGYRPARAEDDQAALTSLLARPGIGDALRAAAEEAIEGPPEEMRYFLEHGQYEGGA